MPASGTLKEAWRNSPGAIFWVDVLSRDFATRWALAAKPNFSPVMF